MTENVTLYALLSCIAMEFLYLLSDYLIYRSKHTEHRGLLDYLHARFKRSSSPSTSKDTTPVPSRSNTVPPM